jgi:exodeoxyribonuclease V beta subunit
MKNRVISASAGTGKTRRIEELVVEFITEERIPVEQILVVTFTEKATFEMKERIRRALESKKAEPGRDALSRELLEEAFNKFDNASIQTIHSFCQGVLKEYAFDTGWGFDAKIVDDIDLAQAIFDRLLRDKWVSHITSQPIIFQEALGATKDYKRKIVCKAVAVAKAEWEILPAPSKAIRTLDSFKFHAKNAVTCFTQGGAGYLPDDRTVEYRGSQGEERKVGVIRNVILVPLGEFFSKGLPPDDDKQAWEALAYEFHGFVAGLDTVAFKDKQFNALLPTNLTSEAIEQRMPGLAKFVESVTGMREAVDTNLYVLEFCSMAAQDVRAELEVQKRSKGLMSYDDMLGLLDKTLTSNAESAIRLCQLLRSRYRAALVDEFQDTDEVQWRIFKTLFLPDAGAGSLSVVGDEKQAIYAFRGADINAWETATKTLNSRADTVPETLDTNWRSLPGLTGGLNGLLSASQWFKDFVGSKWPKEDVRRVVLSSDDSKRPDITIVDLSGPGVRPGDAHAAFARWTADEIVHLVSHSTVKFRIGKEEKTLGFQDICVLVRKGREAAAYRDALRSRRVPYMFYKESGIYTKDEVRHLYFVLKAIASTHDRKAFRKALLTRFFDVKPTELILVEQGSEGNKGRNLFLKWRKLTEKRDWGRLFHSILVETDILKREARNDDGERRIATYLQVIEDLEIMARRDNLDFLDVVQRLYSRIEGGAADEDGDNLLRQESERPAVRIMTMHSAKGLEFPVVFVGGGFGKDMDDKFVKTRLKDEVDPELTKQVLDFDVSRSGATSAVPDDRRNERRRLLYVALTRGMIKLYIPKYVLLNKDGSRGANQGMIGLELLPALNDWAPRPESVQEITPGTPCCDLASVVPSAGGDGKEDVEGGVSNAESVDVSSFRGRAVYVHSFSSLQSHGSAAPQVPEPDAGRAVQDEFGEGVPKVDDEPPAPAAADEDVPETDGLAGMPDEANAWSLPKGENTGSMLHEVFENMDFREVDDCEKAEDLLKKDRIISLIREKLAEYRMRDPAGAEEGTFLRLVCRIVWSALKTTLPGMDISLSKIAPSDCLKELEFMYPCVRPPAGGLTAPEKNYFTGFMDLVFRNGEYLYLLDWKSNWLESYDRPSLEAGMAESDYKKQYLIYVEALRRWLGPEVKIGCVYYLFLRGMTGGVDGVGVYDVAADKIGETALLGQELMHVGASDEEEVE